MQLHLYQYYTRSSAAWTTCPNVHFVSLDWYQKIDTSTAYRFVPFPAMATRAATRDMVNRHPNFHEEKTSKWHRGHTAARQVANVRILSETWRISR